MLVSTGILIIVIFFCLLLGSIVKGIFSRIEEDVLVSLWVIGIVLGIIFGICVSLTVEGEVVEITVSLWVIGVV